MKPVTHFLFAGILYGAFSISSFAQTHVTGLSENSGRMVVLTQPDSRGWTDPALNHNKLMQQQSSDGMYKLIGTYKVVGSSYLFGEHHQADIFAPEAKAFNIFISYNTYNQEVDFYSTSNPDKPLTREPGTLDSFIIHKNVDMGITKPLKFFYGSVLGVKEKNYFMEICTGQRFSLYKRYKSELGYVSDNYVQSELRQFDLQYEYYYTDTASKGIKKIKPNAASVIKEFKDVKDLSAVAIVDDFTVDPENAFRKAFEYLNK
jgi:predicted enzyme related to lactoylglutathione lyase